MSKAPTLLFALLLALTTAAGVVLALGARPDADQEKRAQEFHRLVGGLGFGPAVDLERCAFSFDSRLCPACPNDVGPIPGGMFFCPYHAGAVLDYPPLDPGRDQGKADADLP
jgi:hypothetical protein